MGTWTIRQLSRTVPRELQLPHRFRWSAMMRRGIGTPTLWHHRATRSGSRSPARSRYQAITRARTWELPTFDRETAQDDQLLLEQEILRDHRSHATRATELRGRDGQVKQGEQEILHVRDSVGQPSGATQRCLSP